MASPYGVNIIDNCLGCSVRDGNVFCNLPSAALQRLNAMKSTAVYPKSAVLFLEGEAPRGTFILCSRR
jgi:CRP/FNR family transcriptional regulator